MRQRVGRQQFSISVLAGSAFLLLFAGLTGCGDAEEGQEQLPKSSSKPQSAPKSISKPALRTEPEPQPPTQPPSVRTALAESIAALEQADGRQFLERTLPLPELRRLREQQTLPGIAEGLESDSERRTDLLAIFRQFAAAEPVLHPSGDLATVAVTSAIEDIPAELRELTDPDQQTVPPSTGFADDLPTALRLAADALEGGKLAMFVAKMYPPSDLSDYAAGSRGLETVRFLERQPAMVRQMAADLRTLADSEFQMNSSATVATFSRAGRPVMFQKTGGTWRFFDDSRPIRHAAFDQAQQHPPGAQMTIQFERIGEDWRIYELPPEILDLIFPQSDHSP